MVFFAAGAALAGCQYVCASTASSCRRLAGLPDGCSLQLWGARRAVLSALRDAVDQRGALARPSLLLQGDCEAQSSDLRDAIIS